MPLLLAELSPERLLVGANGHAFEIPRTPQAISWLERLNAGESLRVQELVEGGAPSSGGMPLRELVNKLAGVEAIEVLGAAGQG